MDQDDKGYYVYETKCCRCGELHEWAMSNHQLTISEFHNYMYEKSTFKSRSECRKCEKQTLHEVVAFE